MISPGHLPNEHPHREEANQHIDAKKLFGNIAGRPHEPKNCNDATYGNDRKKCFCDLPPGRRHSEFHLLMTLSIRRSTNSADCRKRNTGPPRLGAGRQKAGGSNLCQVGQTLHQPPVIAAQGSP